MLNSSIKNDFIKQRESEASLDKGFLERIFQKAEPFEDNNGKDVSCFTHLEIEEMYKVWNITSVEYLANINSQLALYTYYCIAHNLVFDGQNHYKEFTINSLMDCTNLIYKYGTIVSRDYIYEILNKLENDVDCFMLLAFYEGFTGDNHCEVSCARLSDFNTETGMVHTYLDRNIKFSKKLYEYAIRANQEEMYYSIGSRKITELINDGYIYKLGKTKNGNKDELYRKGRSIYTRMTKIIHAYFDNPKTTIKDIKTSGKTDYLIQLSKAKEMNPFDAIENTDILLEVDKQYDDRTIKSMYLKKYADAIKSLYEMQQ